MSEDIYDPEAFERAFAQAQLMMRPWGWRIPIIQFLHQASLESPDGWAHVGYRAVADHIGMSESGCYKLLGGQGRLWRVEWVLWRAERGRGQRGSAWRVNPMIETWRGVPWTQKDPLLRATVLEAARADLCRATARHKALARAARTEGTEAPKSARRAARRAALQGVSGGLSAAPSRGSSGVSGPDSRAALHLEPRARSLSRGSDAPERYVEPSLSREQQEDLNTLIEAVNRRVAPEHVFPRSKPRKLLIEAVTAPTFDLASAVAAAESAPDGYQILMVAQHVHTAALGLAVDEVHTDLGRKLENAVQLLEAEIAYITDGGDEPDEELRQRLADAIMARDEYRRGSAA